MSSHKSKNGCGCRLMLQMLFGLAALGFACALLAPGQANWAAPALLVTGIIFLKLTRR